MSENVSLEESEAGAPALREEIPVAESELEEEASMTLLDHLEDLRWVLFKSALAFAAGCAVVATFLTVFAGLLRWPYEFAVRGYEESVAMQGLINTSFLGVFSVIFQLMFIGGLGLSLPLMLYFFGSFIAPGLTPSEKRVLRPGCLAAFFLFLLGAAFSFFILLPLGLRASVIFNDLLGFTLFITASSYYSLLAWAVVGVGLIFQFPLILLLLVYLGVVSAAQLAALRIYAVVFFLILSAIVTPADPITLFVLAVPLQMLYEVSVFLGRRIERWKAATAEDF